MSLLRTSVQRVRPALAAVLAACCILGDNAVASRPTSDMAERLDRMVSTQLETRDIDSPGVLRAMRKVPRPHFIPEGMKDYAFDDSPVPIGHDQTISQPYIVAFMTQALDVRRGDRVLEIGTGSGYQAAVLAEMGAEVYTIEIVEPLYRWATEALSALGYANIHTRLGNGWLGWPEEAPFDKILVTAAPDKIPEALVDQLKEGGKMIVPVGTGHQNLILGVKQSGHFQKIQTIPVRFVPMVGEETAKEAKAKKSPGFR